MKKKHVFRAIEAAASVLAAAVLLTTAPVGSADAYFTTHVEAVGSRILEVGNQPGGGETFSGWTKVLTVTNGEGSQPVYVRARGFSSGYSLSYQDESGRWRDGGDGFYYYSDIVYGGEATSPLQVGISGIPEGEGSFNVAVVYETTPVQYNADGTPYADWNLKVETLETAGSAGE